MAGDYGRIHRLLKILMLIQGQKGWTAKRLAEECGTTERTIFRDMKMLEGAGVPYFHDEKSRGYGVRRDFFLPPVQLTLDEALALATLAGQVGGAEQIPFMKSAERAIAKVKGQLPPALRDDLDESESHLAIHLAARMPPEASADVYETIRRAIAARESLHCGYESATRTGPDARRDDSFIFEPYTLFFSLRAWYVIGLHHGHGKVLCLKLNRFVKLDAMDRPYEIPADFSLPKHLGRAWRMIRGERRYPIHLRFDKAFAETIGDTQWHSTQDIEYNDDGSIEFRCSVDGLDEIVWWVLSMGPHCKVVKPRELADRVRDLAAATAANYAGDRR